MLLNETLNKSIFAKRKRIAGAGRCIALVVALCLCLANAVCFSIAVDESSLRQTCGAQQGEIAAQTWYADASPAPQPAANQPTAQSAGEQQPAAPADDAQPADDNAEQSADPAAVPGTETAGAGQPQTVYCEDNARSGSLTSMASAFIHKFSIDDSAAEAQAIAAACAAPNPCGQPSYAEIRKAKAEAQVAAEAKAAGGDLLKAPDGSSSNPNEVKFVAAPGALAMRIDASQDLNKIDGLPHALVLVIYQLSDRTAFDQLAANPDGIRKLLEGAAFDVSVKSVRQIYIQPGMHSTLALERPEDGKYVAMVAGYNHPTVSSSIFTTSYGLGNYTKKNGLLARSQTIYCPRPLNLIVNLGPSNLSVSASSQAIFDNAQNSAPLR